MCVVASEPLQDLELSGTLLRERPELGADPLTLVRCDLSGADLRGLDLFGWAFHDCNLNDARLTGARLDSALFRGGSARSATFIDSDLADARFEMVDASDARFGGALMSGTEFHGCRLMGTSFEGTRGLGMLLQNCNLYAANLNGCVWFGNDDDTSMGNMTGGSLPAQTWHDVMEPAHRGLELKALPGFTLQPAPATAAAQPGAAAAAGFVANPSVLTRRSGEALGAVEKLFRASGDKRADITGKPEGRTFRTVGGDGEVR